MNSNYKIILQDIQAIIDRDPATRNKLEAILCSSGLHAIIIHRFSHFLWKSTSKTVKFDDFSASESSFGVNAV